MLAAITNNARYVCVPTRYGLFNVVDTATGSPAEVDVTTVLLTWKEARRLVAWLNGSGGRSGPAADHWIGQIKGGSRV